MKEQTTQGAIPKMESVSNVVCEATLKSMNTQIVQYDLTSIMPSPDEIERLSKVPFPEKELSIAESRRILDERKMNLLLVFIGAGAFILCVFFIVFVFKGLGVLGCGFMGLGGLAMALMGIQQLTSKKLLSKKMLLSAAKLSGRKTSPEDSLKWIWEAILDTHYGGKNYDYDCILGCCNRAIHGKLDDVKMKVWITGFRDELESTMWEVTSPLISAVWSDKIFVKTGLGAGRSIIKEFKSIKITENIGNDAVKMSALIEISDSIVVRDKNSTEKILAVPIILELHVSQIFIKNGEFWHPYDLMPTYMRRVTNQPPSD